MNLHLRSLWLLLLCCVVGTSVAQTTIEPGAVVQFHAADNCAVAEDGGLLGLGLRTNVRCDPATATLGAEIDVGAFGDIGKLSARSALWIDFDVAATPDTAGNLVAAWLSYDVFWKGLLQQFDIVSTSSVQLGYEIIDRTTGQVVKAELMWGRDAEGPKGKLKAIPIQVTRNVDEDRFTDTVSVVMTRGNTYRFLLRLRCDATLFGETGGTKCDYFTDNLLFDRGAGLHSLQVKLGQDDRETLERLEELRQDVERLKNHTHDYLTGHGQGHNNTEATTSPPNLEDDGGDPSSMQDDTGVPPTTIPAGQPNSDAQEQPAGSASDLASGGSASGGGGAMSLVGVACLAGLVLVRKT